MLMTRSNSRPKLIDKIAAMDVFNERAERSAATMAHDQLPIVLQWVFAEEWEPGHAHRNRRCHASGRLMEYVERGRHRLVQPPSEQIHPAVGVQRIFDGKGRIGGIDDAAWTGSRHQRQLIVQSVHTAEVPVGQLRKDLPADDVHVELNHEPGRDPARLRPAVKYEDVGRNRTKQTGKVRRELPVS